MSECIWSKKLDKSTKEVTFSGSSFYTEDDDTEYKHSLLLKQVTLVAVDESAADEMNVIEVETSGFQSSKLKFTLCCLQASKQRLFHNQHLDLLFNEDVTFRLKGSGPVTIVGQHMIEYVGNELEDCEEEEPEDEEEDPDEEQDIELNDKENLKSIKRKLSNPQGLPKKMAKKTDKELKVQVVKMEMEDEEESDPEDEEIVQDNKEKSQGKKGKGKAAATKEDAKENKPVKKGKKK